ncbi:MAG: Mur ligase family protein, partial [Acidimicrobiia bacterium]|nr:Mur ligase family protein [Acidimicrobiia bacterium]
MSKLPLGISRAIANAVGRLSRLLGRGGGTTAPGVALLKLRPRAVAELAPTLGGPSVVISATNGKTTTARLLSSCVEADGRSVLANRSGSNLLRGVAAALLDVDGTDQTGVFEVDEAALSEVTAQLEPDVVALMNLFRDQLDRYGELEHLADRWVEIVSALPESTIAVLNADDPAIAELGQHHDNVVYFGLDDPAIARTDLQHAADSVTCRNCAAPLTYDTIHLSHLGHWRCTNCGRRRPTPSVTATEVRLDGLDATHLIIATASGPITTTVSLPGVHNAYNVVAATAAALALDIDPDTIGPALTATEAAFGRAE